MLKRIINKGVWYTDLAVGKIALFAEKKKIIKSIPFTILRRSENAVRVEHKYPANFSEQDKHLFAHYTGYTSGKEEVFLLKDVNVNYMGVVFKGLKNFGPAIPHPIFRNKFGIRYLLGQYLFLRKKEARSNKRYVLVHDFWSYGNYYHFIIDSLPRLNSVIDDLKTDNYSLILHTPHAKFIDSILKYYDFKNITIVNNNEYLHIKELIVPNYLAGSGHIHPPKVQAIRSFFLEKILSASTKEKIYISRARQKTRRIINEAQVVELLSKYGFEVIYWEDRTFEEQVQIARNTKYMISSHGANLTNLMFMDEGAKVLEIIKEKDPNFCYWALASVAKVDYYYQLTKVPESDNLFVDIELLKQNVERMLND
jgi:hypothetical protein